MPMCNEENWGMLPFYQLMVPNPESELGFDYLQQPVSNPTKEDVKKWITKNLANNAETLTTKEEFDSFVEESDINKILLISKRSKVPPIYRVLSSTLFKKMRVGFTTHDSPIAEQFGKSDFPAVVVFDTYDTETKLDKKTREEIWFEGDEFKVDKLIKFTKPFTRDNPKVAERSKSSSGKKKDKKQSGKK